MVVLKNGGGHDLYDFFTYTTYLLDMIFLLNISTFQGMSFGIQIDKSFLRGLFIVFLDRDGLHAQETRRHQNKQIHVDEI